MTLYEEIEALITAEDADGIYELLTLANVQRKAREDKAAVRIDAILTNMVSLEEGLDFEDVQELRNQLILAYTETIHQNRVK